MKNILLILMSVMCSVCGVQAGVCSGGDDDFDPVLPGEPGAKYYELVLTCSPATAGYCTGSGKYASGETVKITAVPNAGYRFIRWERENGELVTENNPYTLTKLNSREAFVAIFDESPSEPGNSGQEDVDGILPSATVMLENAGQMSSAWTSVCVSFPFVVPDDLTAWVGVKQERKGHYAYLTMEKIETGKVSAGFPILLSGNKGSYTIVSMTSAEITDFNQEISQMPQTNLLKCYANEDLGSQSVYKLTDIDESYPVFVKKNSQEISVGDVYFPTSENDVKNKIRLLGFEDTDYLYFPLEIGQNIEAAGQTTAGGSFMPGTSISITAEENAHYQFLNWAKDGANISSEKQFVYEKQDVSESIVAQFAEDPKFQVVVSDNDQGTVTIAPASVDVYQGTQVTLTAVPKDGYDFDAWSDGSTSNPYSFVLTQNVSLSVAYKPRKYAIEYLVDGAVFLIDSVAYLSVPPVVREPKKEGYTFIEWEGVPQVMPACNITVHAKFSLNRHAISYYVDGVFYGRDSCDYGVTIELRDTPVKEGHGFSGWSEVPETMPDKDISVSGTFAKNKYNLEYFVDGQKYKTVKVEYGAAVVPVSAPVIPGYSFSGWEGIPETMPAHDVSVSGTLDLMGDLDNDEVITENDISIYAKYLLGKISLEINRLTDITGDGKISLIDITKLISLSRQ